MWSRGPAVASVTVAAVFVRPTHCVPAALRPMKLDATPISLVCAPALELAVNAQMPMCASFCAILRLSAVETLTFDLR